MFCMVVMVLAFTPVLQESSCKSCARAITQNLEASHCFMMLYAYEIFCYKCEYERYVVFKYNRINFFTGFGICRYIFCVDLMLAHRI